MRGVITGIVNRYSCVDEDLERLKQSIYGGKVSGKKRLKRTINGESVYS